jgi:NAD(P)-dependent dehydrogenase (short-subunit alcohol dehydrogenase family)
LIGVLGSTSRIAVEFASIVKEPIAALGLDAGVCRSTNRLLICTGYLAGKSLANMTSTEASSTWRLNFMVLAEYVDRFMAQHEDGRVVVIGSDSAFAGSYDVAYAGAKAALHLYVETRRLAPRQQLVAIAPSIIEDGAMTTRRTDHANLERRRLEHPKRRFCTAREVASLAAWLLGPDGEYVSGTVIRQNGGMRK